MHGNKYPEDPKDELDDIYEDSNSLLPVAESPEEAAVDEPGEYWNGLTTPPQCYTTREPTTPRRNVPPPSAPPSRQVAPSRWWRKGPSRSGRVAYVLFGGLGDEPGLYHNWDSLAAVLSRYQNGHAPAFLGSDTEEEAVNQYRHYEITGEIPLKVRIYRKILLLDGTVVGVNPPPHRDVPPQASPNVGARRSPAYSKLVSPPSTPTHPTPTRRRAERSPHAPSPSQAISPAAARGRLYYVVLEGHTPGVYNTNYEAIRAAGPFSGASVLTASTRASANQMFVDGFMTGRISVSSLSSRSGR